jgi:D-alanine-D-alanine ligase
VDVRLDAAGEPQLIEVNPLAGLTPGHSDLPILADLLGMEYRELIRAILACALNRLGLSSERVAAA